MQQTLWLIGPWLIILLVVLLAKKDWFPQRPDATRIRRNDIDVSGRLNLPQTAQFQPPGAESNLSTEPTVQHLSDQGLYQEVNAMVRAFVETMANRGSPGLVPKTCDVISAPRTNFGYWTTHGPEHVAVLQGFVVTPEGDWVYHSWEGGEYRRTREDWTRAWEVSSGNFQASSSAPEGNATLLEARSTAENALKGWLASYPDSRAV
jgi:hypothetical protein